MSVPTFQHLLLETDSTGIATLTINRPDKLNALNSNLLQELNTALSFIETENSIRVVILKGSGEKAFVAGADIKELRDLDKQTGEELSSAGQQIFDRIESSEKPFIALINGYALGGGAELAMACHIRIATENALIGLPEVTLGIIPGYGGTQRLPALVGYSKAMEMILTGKPVNALEANKIGLVNYVLPPDQAMKKTNEIALTILQNGPVAISKSIKAVLSSRADRGFTKEAVLFGELCETDDFKEGTSAFLEKRKAIFKNK